jgi:hypothetical protein
MQAHTKTKEDAHLPDTHGQKQEPILIDVSGSLKPSKVPLGAASNSQGWAQGGGKDEALPPLTLSTVEDCPKNLYVNGVGLITIDTIRVSGLPLQFHDGPSLTRGTGRNSLKTRILQNTRIHVGVW